MHKVLWHITIRGVAGYHCLQGTDLYLHCKGIYCGTTQVIHCTMCDTTVQTFYFPVTNTLIYRIFATVGYAKVNLFSVSITGLRKACFSELPNHPDPSTRCGGAPKNSWKSFYYYTPNTVLWVCKLIGTSRIYQLGYLASGFFPLEYFEVSYSLVTSGSDAI